MGSGSAPEIWEAALGELQIQVNRPNYRTWLAKTVGLSYQDNQFVVGVPNTFVAEYLDKNQRSLIEKTLTGLTRQNTEVTFKVNGRHTISSDNYGSRQARPSSMQASFPFLNPRYTFDSFVVGSSNHLAYAAALEVARNPGHSYNPLFIYGGSGLGKTHLLHAIGHAALARGAQLLYVSAEQFTSEFIHSIRNRRTDEFRDKYRTIDTLLLDDIHFINGKEQTGENLCHIFNDLYHANRQIVFTSDCSPKSMPLLAERLRSRLEWGLVADIEPPDYKTRLAILQARVEKMGANVAPEVLQFLARQLQQNVRALEGSLNRLIAYAKLVGSSLTPELAAKALKDLAGNTARTTSITPDLIIEVVANSFRISPEDLKGRQRSRETDFARKVAMYLVRQETSCSLAQIGKCLGDRDHHIISQANKQIAHDLAIDPALKEKISDIQQLLYHQHPR